MRRLAVGLSALSALCLSSATAATLEGVLESTTNGAIAPWQTVYLMSEGSADARVVGPLNRGAKVTVDPDKSSDQYWYVQVPGSPGGQWQGYVWKHFVKVSAAPAKTASPAPVADAKKKDKSDKTAAKSKDPLLAYDAEIFEVDEGPVVPRARPALAAEPVPPPPSFSMMPSAVSPSTAPKPAFKDVAPAAAPSPAAPAEPARLSEAELASPLRQIQGLREQIERELDAAPATSVPTNVDQLVVRLNEILKVERSIVGFLESTGKMVDAHDKRIKELSTRVQTLSTKGPERAGLSDEVTKLRKRLDELSTTVSSTRQHAKRLDALEAKLRRGGEGAGSIAGLRTPGGGAIDADSGAIVLGSAPRREPKPAKSDLDVEFDRRADQLEEHLYDVKRKARKLQSTIDEDEVDIPHIDARQVEREQRRERQVSEGVVEVLDAPNKRIPPGGTVASMLVKLRDLRELRRKEREAVDRRVRGLAPEDGDAELLARAAKEKAAAKARAKAKPKAPPVKPAITDADEPKPLPPPSDEERAAVEQAAEYEDTEPDVEPVLKKRAANKVAKRKLDEIQGLLSARLD